MTRVPVEAQIARHPPYDRYFIKMSKDSPCRGPSGSLKTLQ